MKSRDSGLVAGCFLQLSPIYEEPPFGTLFTCGTTAPSSFRLRCWHAAPFAIDFGSFDAPTCTVVSTPIGGDADWLERFVIGLPIGHLLTVCGKSKREETDQ